MTKKNFQLLLILFSFIIINYFFINHVHAGLSHDYNYNDYQYHSISFNLTNNYGERTFFLPIGLDEQPSIYQSGLTSDTQIKLFSLTIDQLIDNLIHHDYKIKNDIADYSQFNLLDQYSVKEIMTSKSDQTKPLKLNGFGVWYIVAQSKEKEQGAFIIRSPLASMVKNGDNNLILWTQDLATGNQKFHGQAKVYSLNQNRQLLHEAPFGDDRLLEIPYYQQADLILVESDFGQSIIPLKIKEVSFDRDHSWSSSSYSIYQPTSKYYLFTDRPLYKPGDKIFFKAISRTNDDYRYQISQKDMMIEISRGYGNEKEVLFTQLYQPNNFGAIDGHFDLPATLKPDYYEIKILPHQNSDISYYSSTFQVQEYLKPEYILAIESSQNQVVAGEQYQVKVSGESYSGWPMTGVNFEYCINQSFSFYDCDRWQTAQFDQHGQAIITLDSVTSNPHQSYYDWDYDYQTFAVRYSDGLSQPITEYKRFAVYNTPYKFIFPQDYESDVYWNTDYDWQVNETQKITGQLTSMNQASVANQKIELTIDRYPKTFTTTLSTQTDNFGNFNFDFIPTESGSYDLTYKVYYRDSYSSTRRYHYVLKKDQDMKTTANQASLTLTSDNNQYVPGAQFTPNYQIKSDIGNRDFFANFGRARVGHYYLSNFGEKNHYLLREDDYPNTYFSASFFDRNNYLSNSTEVNMKKEFKKINLTITPDKDIYQPGEKIKVKLKTINELTQKPVISNITLWTIDQSLYSLASDQRTNIFDVFWSKGHNWLYTYHSLQGINIYGAEMGGGGGMPDPRSIFKDNAYWNPNIITNDDGEAEIEFILPDNLTTWVLSGVALSQDTQVGENTINIKVQKPVVSRVLSPEVMRVGDILHLGLIATNYTDKPETFTVIWQPDESFKTLDPLLEPIVLQAGETRLFSWRTEVVQANPKAKIQAGINNLFHSELSDLMIKEVKVMPYGYLHNSTEFSLQPKTFNIPLNEDLNLNYSHLKLNLSTNILGGIQKSMEKLIDYPRGCVEQTTSRFVPVLIARDYPLFAQQDFGKNLDELTNMGIKNLFALQNNDGSWGFWHPNNEGDAFKTAYVIKYLLQADSQSTPILEDKIFLASQFFRSVLERYNHFPSGQLSYQQQAEVIPSLYGLLLIEQKYPQMKIWPPLEYGPQNQDAKYYHSLLISSSIKAVDLLAWALQIDLILKDQFNANNHLHKLLSAEKNNQTSQWHNDSYTRYRSLKSDTALTLQAVINYHQVYRQAEKDINDLVVKLLKHYQKNYWYSTFTTAQTIEALAQWHKNNPPISNNSQYQIIADKQIIGTVDFALEAEQSKNFEFQLSNLDLSQGQIEVKSSSQSVNQPIFITFSLDKWVKNAEVPNLNANLKLYKVAVREKEVQPDQPLKPGEILTIYVGLENSGNTVDYVDIEDYLPSNLRPLKSNQGYYANSQVTFTGIQTTLYRLQKGMNVFSYQAVVTNQAEKYSIPPTIITAMYDPNFYFQNNIQPELEILSQPPEWFTKAEEKITPTVKKSYSPTPVIQANRQLKLSLKNIIGMFAAAVFIFTAIIAILESIFPTKFSQLKLRLKIIFYSILNKLKK